MKAYAYLIQVTSLKDESWKIKVFAKTKIIILKVISDHIAMSSQIS